MKFNEQITVENHIISFLTKELGYRYVKPEEFKTLRKFENEYLIESYIADAIRRINGVEDDTIIQSVLREIKKIDTNQDFLNAMRDGIDLIDAESRKTKNYRFIDLKEPTNNDFVVTNQFYFEGDVENIRPDVMIFVNGIPLVDIEAKSPTVGTNVDYQKAIGQIARYQRTARKLFIPNAFNIATDGQQTVYGATGAPKQYWLSWKEEELEKKYDDKKLEVTLVGLLEPGRLCDILANFIVYEQTKEGVVKKVARYQQLRAANKVVDRVAEGEKHRGLIWHTQGSGKTLSMFFAAWKLRFHPELDSPKIFILVDRIDLDDQIYDEFINHGGKNIERVTSVKDLKKRIASDERGIFISTMQKFAELGDDVENLSKNIIVFSDEAHRNDEGKAGINMRSALGNAYFFGFTGTPIDKTTLNTHRNYGEEGERYLDYYSIQQAIDDRTTLPVAYEARLSKFFIDEEKVDEGFEGVTEGLESVARDKVMKKYSNKSALVKLPTRMEAIARDIVEHFRAYVEPNGFKAQVVCYDREASALYKELLDEFIPAEWSAVVYSPGDPNDDTEQLRKYNSSKRERDEIIRNFKNPDQPLRFLIVCDMLLTGFDAPIEQVMYLDKPLRDHTLLQAIARTNRVYPHKKAGKIIDYYGITRNLYDALDFDEEIVESAMVDIEIMKQRFEETLAEVMALFGKVNIEDPSMENLRRNLKIFIDNEDKQKFFRKKYNALKSLYEFLAPDPFLKPYIRQFEWLTAFYMAFMKEFYSVEDQHLLGAYGEKVRELIREHVDYEGITRTFRELRIDDIATMNKLNEMDDEEKALQLEKMLTQEISEDIETNPVFKKFSERLQKIRGEFEKRQMDLAERIKKYEELMKDIKSAREEAKELGYDLREYGLYAISKEYLENVNEDVLREFIHDMSHRLDGILDDGWQESSKHDVFIKDVKRVLQEMVLKDYRKQLNMDTKEFHAYMNRLVDMIVKKF